MKWKERGTRSLRLTRLTIERLEQLAADTGYSVDVIADALIRAVPFEHAQWFIERVLDEDQRASS